MYGRNAKYKYRVEEKIFEEYKYRVEEKFFKWRQFGITYGNKFGLWFVYIYDFQFGGGGGR